MSVSVLIVDDHPLIRMGLADLIENAISGVTTEVASNQKQASTLLRKQIFDLVIIDILLPDGNGMELVQRLRANYRQTKWLVLSSMSDSFHQMRAKLAGANGFLNKGAEEQEMIQAVRTIINGGSYPEDFLLNGKIGQKTADPTNPLSKLSEREMTVFQLIAEGNSVEKIASSLSRSRKTINALRDRIRTKLNISSSAELNRFATYWYMSQSTDGMHQVPSEKNGVIPQPFPESTDQD